MTALMQAVKSQDAARVKELIRQGVNVSELDANGDALLVIAAYEGLTEIVRLLLEAGADVTAVDPGMKATALHAAAYAGRMEAAKLLIEYKVEIDKQGPYNGYTALHDAIWQGHVETVRVIIEAGANLTLKNNLGQTPLEFARSKGHQELVALLEQKLG
jgi:ankyrin repeat protein